MVLIKVLELFAGTKSVSNAFKERGHEVFTVDWDEEFDVDLHADISELTAQEIIEKFGRPDVIWASPDCTSYSVAAISHHRRRDSNGNLEPVTEYAKFCDETNKHVLELIKELKPKYYFIENPRGGMRKMDFMQNIPRYTVTYCSTSSRSSIMARRPRFAWRFEHWIRVISPNVRWFLPPFPILTITQGILGAKDRAKIPQQLCRHIVDICEEENSLGDFIWTFEV